MKNKALVNHEIRNIWPVFIYFLGCMIVGLVRIAMDLNGTYIDYLAQGYQEDWPIYFCRPLQNMEQEALVFLGAGVALLLYMQFKDNKSLRVSSFIKSLPYTNKEVYKVKLECGLIAITIAFVAGTIGTLGIRSRMNEFLSYIQNISIIGSEIKNLDSVGHIMLYVLLLYGIIIFLYLFGFWMQYLVSNNVASIVISALVLGAIPFIVASGTFYMQCMINLKRCTGWVLEALVKVVCPVMYLDMNSRSFSIYNPVDDSYMGMRLPNAEFTAMKLLVLVVLIGMLILAIALCNKNYKAESQESFISTAWAEKIFKIGVVISCIGVAVFVADGVIGTYTIGQKVMLHLAMLGTGLIAYVIGCKICAIGKR